MSIMESISCLTTIVQAKNDLEASQMIDIVKQLRVPQKHLIITIPELNINYLQNLTINFNVMIKPQTKGDTRCRSFSRDKLRIILPIR